LETKKQFSDGVGYGWIDKLKEVVAVEVTDEQLASAKFRFRCRRLLLRKNITTVLYSMNIFQVTPQFMCASRGKCSMQYKIALEWDEAFKNMNDPSGRAVANVHSDAYAKV
jgi:asparagine synthase (glutamine-hydrolysing)